MATPRELSDSEHDEEQVLEKEIRELQSEKKTLFEEAKPINEKLERIAQRERECRHKLHNIASERHDRTKYRQTVQRLVELESDLQRVKCENAKLSNMNRKLKQSLDQATKYSKIQKEKIVELDLAMATAQQQRSEIYDDSIVELQKQLSETRKLLNKAKEELNETRQRLCEVQERLTVAEQVTAATQQRAVRESDNSDELLLEVTSQHRSTIHTAYCDVLRSLYSELTTMLDARVVAVHMYQRNALTLKELQSIQSLRDRPVEAAETLLNIVMEQPDAVYLCFLDVLKHTEQQHIYQRLVEDGYQDYDEQSSHTSVIRKHYVFLLETLDVKITGLVGHLYSDQVISAVEIDDISAEQTSFRANEKLLSVLSRKSPQQFQLFLNALDKCGQQHVRNVISGRPGKQETCDDVTATLQVAAVASQTDEDVTAREQMYDVTMAEMIYQLLSHTIGMKSNKLMDELVTRGILSPRVRKKIKEQKKIDDRVNSLMMILREMSAAEFDRFLTTLSETGQQSIADVVHQALDTVGQTGRNPLQYARVGQVVHTLPEGQAVVGVTSLGDEVFLLRLKSGGDQVEVYDVIAYRLLRCITVTNIRGFVDMTSCEHYHCLYISDHIITCIHRVDLQGATTHWAVNDQPDGLSVTKAHNVLITCCAIRKIKEFSSHGASLREMTLPDDVINPRHAILLTTGQYVVCHGSRVLDDAVHRVCVMSENCTHIVHSHGGQCGSDIGQYNVPAHLAVDDNEFVFVADNFNQRVTLLSPTLNYIRQVVSRDKLKWLPFYLHLDVQRRRLYVADNEYKYGEVTAGRVVVFSV